MKSRLLLRVLCILGLAGFVVALAIAAPVALKSVRPARIDVAASAAPDELVEVAQAPSGASATASVSVQRRTAQASTPAARPAPRAAARGRRPGYQRRGAFGPGPVQSKDNFLYMLQQYPEFRQNLARHFKVSEGDLIGYINDNLRLVYLPRDTKVTTYGVTAAGRVFPVRQTMPAGSLVFALPDGTAVIKEICGNPLLAYLPPVPSPTSPTASIIPAQPIPELFQPTVASGRLAPPGAQPFTTTFAPGVPETVFQPELIAAAPVAVTPVMAMAPSEAAAFGGGGGGFVPWPLLGLIYFAFDGDDDGRRPHRTGVPRPIPEPSTNLAMALGVAVVAGGCLYRRRRTDGRRRPLPTIPRQLA